MAIEGVRGGSKASEYHVLRKRTVRDFSWTELAVCTLLSVFIALPAYLRDPRAGAADLIGRIAGSFIVVILVVKAAKMIFRAITMKR